MKTISGTPLTKALAVLGLFLAVTEGRPGTNFAGSSMTSDDSGTRSSHIIGSIPDDSSSIPNTRIYSIPNVGNGSGATVLTTRNGGGATILTGTSGSGGGVGVVSSSGPNTGGRTQYSVLVPSNTNNSQPSVLGRFGSPPSGISSGAGTGVYAGPYGGPGAGSGAYAGPYGAGASSGAFAGPSGASAGAYAGPTYSDDYYG